MNGGGASAGNGAEAGIREAGGVKLLARAVEGVHVSLKRVPELVEAAYSARVLRKEIYRIDGGAFLDALLAEQESVRHDAEFGKLRERLAQFAGVEPRGRPGSFAKAPSKGRELRRIGKVMFADPGYGEKLSSLTVAECDRSGLIEK